MQVVECTHSVHPRLREWAWLIPPCGCGFAYLRMRVPVIIVRLELSSFYFSGSLRVAAAAVKSGALSGSDSFCSFLSSEHRRSSLPLHGSFFSPRSLERIVGPCARPAFEVAQAARERTCGTLLSFVLF